MATTSPERIASALRLAIAAKPLWIEASGGSMGRAIVSGSEVQVAEAARPRLGEVWAFCVDDGAIVVHRYRGRHGGQFVFEGDATDRADRPVDQARLIGRVIAVRADDQVKRLGQLDAIRGAAAGLLKRFVRFRRSLGR